MTANADRIAKAKTWAGVRSAHVARSTGTLIVVFDGQEQGLDTDGGRWSVVCDDHGGVMSVDRLRDARQWATHPEDWCPDCMNEREEETRNWL